PVDVGRQFRIGSLGTLHPAALRAQTGEEVAYGAGALHFGVGEPDAGDGMRVAPADADLVQALGKALRLAIGAPPHLPVAHFKVGSVGSKPVKVLGVALAGKPGKHVIDAEK